NRSFVLSCLKFQQPGGGAHALKRIPRIKFPNRHHKSSGSTSETHVSPSTSGGSLSFFSSSKASTTTTLGGKASLQPKRTPVTNEEIEAVLLGGCF
ncbi:uncharacterized protein, partial [Cicer arietinum]|uniref:Uncharacterized protein LOC101508778 n=1 Tax=Cicer arietinum TaxID=3827 RepID=A0A1S2YEZ2_CICAR